MKIKAPKLQEHTMITKGDMGYIVLSKNERCVSRARARGNKYFWKVLIFDENGTRKGYYTEDSLVEAKKTAMNFL